MGLAIETIRQHFPRTAKALRQHHQLIERISPLTDADRTRLKTSANMLVVIAVEEATALKENLTSLAKAITAPIDLLKSLKR